MVIGRLLLPKLTPHFNTRGFKSLTKRCLSPGWKYERLRDYEASTNRDIGQYGMHWHSFGGLVTKVKQKIMGNVLMMDKNSGEDPVSQESAMVSSSDVTAARVPNLKNVAESKNCITSSAKEESSISEIGYQDASKSVVGVEPSGKRESKSVSSERLNSLDFAQENLLRLIPAEKVKPPEDLSSNNVSLCSLTEEVSESLVSSGENLGKLQPEKRQSDQAKPPQGRLSNLFIISNPYKEVKFPLRVEASQSVVRVEPSGKRESKSVNSERLGSLDFALEKWLKVIPAEKVDPPEELSSNNVSLCSLTEEVSESLVSSRENLGKLLPDKRQSDQAKPPQDRLSNLFINSNPYKDAKFPLRVEASQSVVGVEFSEKRESISARLDDNSNNNLGGLDFAQEKFLRLIPAEKVNSLEEPTSNNVSLCSLTEEVSETLESLGENLGKLLPKKRQPYKAKPPLNSLLNLFINSNPYKEVKFPLRVEALSDSNSSVSTKQSCSDVGGLHSILSKMLSDPIQETKSISNENDKHRLSDTPRNSNSFASTPLKGGNHDQKIVDLTAIRERERTSSSENSSKTVVPVAVSREFGMKKLMDSFNLLTDNRTDADAILWNPNDGEGKYVSKDNSVTKTSNATEGGESKGETIVMQDQSLCSEAVLATNTVNSKVTKKSLFTLPDDEYSPNRVLLRFWTETLEKKEIVDAFSIFGAVSDVQEIPSYKGCIYKDALVTFETNSAMKMALAKAVVRVKTQSVVVEAASQEDMVEKICIPDLIGDPDVPIELVKEPTRTVKIHPLEHDISSNQIKEALKFCKNDISKIIFSSSKRAAFVEFKTEDGKERALEEHSINILEKQLFIYRIDTPRTTVVRINLLELPVTNTPIRKLCKPYGQIKQVYVRGKYIADVHYNISEWPNMVTILNSLNGKKMDGMKWVVRPATNVIPPEILKVLWEDPREKRYVKSVIENLMREIVKQPLDVIRSHTLVRDLLP